MIKCTSIFTAEIDDARAALAELTAQLDSGIELQRETIGIMTCHPEFIYSGTAKYVAENLPFMTLGVTTAAQAVNSGGGDLVLSIFVISSDELVFRCGLTDDLSSGIQAPTRAAFETASAGMGEMPALALVFPPLILEHAGDLYPQVWSELLPGTPAFGTLAIDDTVTFENSETLFRGGSSKTQMAFALVYGDIRPRFLVSTLPESNTMPYQGQVTSSDGPYVHEINNINAYKFFEEIGFAQNGSPTDSFLFVPFLLDQRKRADYDGVPVLRVLASFDEKGSAIFRGNMDQDSIFQLSRCNEGDVVASAIQRYEDIAKMEDVNGILGFSCIIRHMVLGTNGMAEFDEAAPRLKAPFLLAYAGGEVCPTSINDGLPSNRYHNYSFISLII